MVGVGTADGVPMLFSPGAATSGSLGLAGDAVERLGIRLIAIDRPGLGRSDPAPDRTLLDTAADLRALGAAFALERPTIIGFSQGAPLTLACADWLSAVAVVPKRGISTPAFHAGNSSNLGPRRPVRRLSSSARGESLIDAAGN